MRNLMNILFRRCTDVVRCSEKIRSTRRCYSTWGAKPELTSVRYKMQRGPYATISSADIRFFESLVGSNRLITDPDECEGYNIDFPKTVRGERICYKRIFNLILKKRNVKLYRLKSYNNCRCQSVDTETENH